MDKYKARFVVKGYVQRQIIDFDKVFASVARLETITLLIALATTNGWDTHHPDVKTVLLKGDLKD